MGRAAWKIRKTELNKTVLEFSETSPVFAPISVEDLGDEWRLVASFDTRTLVMSPAGEVEKAGPIVMGIRYHERFLSQAPHPFEIAVIFEPRRVFHPNCDYAGTMCLGHPTTGLSLETILNQVWAGLNINMNTVRTMPGRILNPHAAEYVRANAPKFPLTRRGLLEEPEPELANPMWRIQMIHQAAQQLARRAPPNSQPGNSASPADGPLTAPDAEPPPDDALPT
jgi:hypothetical protein